MLRVLLRGESPSQYGSRGRRRDSSGYQDKSHQHSQANAQDDEALSNEVAHGSRVWEGGTGGCLGAPRDRFDKRHHRTPTYRGHKLVPMSWWMLLVVVLAGFGVGQRCTDHVRPGQSISKRNPVAGRWAACESRSAAGCGRTDLLDRKGVSERRSAARTAWLRGNVKDRYETLRRTGLDSGPSADVEAGTNCARLIRSGHVSELGDAALGRRENVAS